ncbi:MAG: haloacid dehalogenase type II [Chloroflexota bacterium]
MAANLSSIKALTFDVFGTVVDWRSTIITEGKQWGKQKKLTVDWEAFADAWRAGYGPSMQKVRAGELGWTKIDDLHRMILDDLLLQFDIAGLSEADKDHWNRVWHRLQPWPDAVEGLTRLKQQYVIATLSNGNVSLLTNMAKNAGLPWDCILSAELAGHYKPDAEVYLKAADLLGLQPNEVMMVAAHNGDLLAAQKLGLRTAFIPRPTEYGPDQSTDLIANEAVDIVATDFVSLAAKLKAQS